MQVNQPILEIFMVLLTGFLPQLLMLPLDNLVSLSHGLIAKP